MAALTLADIEAIAERYSGAVKTIREASALLGVGPPIVASVTVSSPSVNNFTPAEMAQRQKLLTTIRGEDLPADIRAAEGL